MIMKVWLYRMADKWNIFLDVDGVLNREADWARPWTLNRSCMVEFGKYLRRLQEKAEVRIFLSSSWRKGFSTYERCSPQVEDLKRALAPYGVRIYGKTEEGADRGQEIGRFIKMHHLNPASCIVIDDDKSLFEAPLPAGCKTIWINAVKGFVAG